MARRNPKTWRKDVILRDGTSLRLRTISPDDGQKLYSLFKRLSPTTIYFRFMGVLRDLTEAQLHRFTHLDAANEMALVGVLPAAREPGGEKLIAVGRFVRLPVASHAEVAFTVEDGYQNLGIGAHLLQELIFFARMAEIEVLEAEVLAENRRMLGLFRDMGFKVTSRMAHGVVHIEFPIAETEIAEERRWLRDQSARAASLERIFHPASVAVIGASPRRGKPGNVLLHNLRTGGFSGPIYPVNPRYRKVAGLPCYPSLLEVPGKVELVLIAVPAAQVLEAVRQCAERHAYAVVIYSAGFAETGPRGRRLQERVLELSRRHGMRMVGPNSMGLLTTTSGERLNATLAPVQTPPGHVAFGSQSGALGIAILSLARQLRLGLSQFVSVGNKADISGNDLLYYWGDDPETRVILLYLESFGNPRKFSLIARQVGERKPIVVLKSGTSPAGQRAAASHTGAAPSAPAITDTLLRQAGITRCDTMEQLFHTAKVLGTQPLPAGGRTAILTNAGGPGILCADRAEAEGLQVPRLSQALRKRLARHLPPEARLANPVDMLFTATPAQYEACLRLLLRSEEVHQVVVLFIPAAPAAAAEVARAVVKARQAAGRGKPVVATVLGAHGMGEAEELLNDAGVPAFHFPEDAVAALARLTAYRNWRMAPKGRVVRFGDVRHDEAREIIEAGLEGRTGGPARWLSPEAAFRLLRCYRIPALPLRFAASAAQAGAVAGELGFPVVVRPAGGSRPAPGGQPQVCTSLRAVQAAFATLSGGAGRGVGRERRVLLHALREGEPEVQLGMRQDSHFGPVMMAGLAAPWAEEGAGPQLGLHPISDSDCRRMIAGLHLPGTVRRGRARLAGLGTPLLRLSQLVAEHPHIQDVVVDPMIGSGPGSGWRAAGVRVRVAPVEPYEEFVLSRLRD